MTRQQTVWWGDPGPAARLCGRAPPIWSLVDARGACVEAHTWQVHGFGRTVRACAWRGVRGWRGGAEQLVRCCWARLLVAVHAVRVPARGLCLMARGRAPTSIPVRGPPVRCPGGAQPSPLLPLPWFRRGAARGAGGGGGVLLGRPSKHAAAVVRLATGVGPVWRREGRRVRPGKPPQVTLRTCRPDDDTHSAQAGRRPGPRFAAAEHPRRVPPSRRRPFALSPLWRNACAHLGVERDRAARRHVVPPCKPAAPSAQPHSGVIIIILLLSSPPCARPSVVCGFSCVGVGVRSAPAVGVRSMRWDGQCCCRASFRWARTGRGGGGRPPEEA